MATAHFDPEHDFEEVVATEEMQQHRSLREDVWRQFKRHKGGVIGLIILTFIVIATLNYGLC